MQKREHSRRDNRKGTFEGYLVPKEDGIEIKAVWADPLAGQNVDFYRISEDKATLTMTQSIKARGKAICSGRRVGNLRTRAPRAAGRQPSLVLNLASLGEGEVVTQRLSLDRAIADAQTALLAFLASGMHRARALPSASRRLIAGGVSGAVSKTVTAPLETLKMKLVQGGSVTVVEAARAVLASRGVGGFFAGNTIDVLRTVPSKALELAAFDSYKRTLRATPWVPDRAIGAVAGGLAGITSTVAIYPLETVRTRMAVNGHTFVQTLQRVGSHGGLPGLYRGLDASLIGTVPYTAIRLGLYDALKYSWKRATGKEHLDPQASLVFGAVAGVVSATVTFPLEVARRRMMVGAAYPNTAVALATIARTEGASALFNGVWLALVKQAPQYAIGFMVYEQCKRALAL
ncbi:Adenine nucleotide transporter BT1, chloroplastic/amyloplastic/mitochondrial [Auxenochlorella protothecoides]|uniref:Adenine nucleotide transporter BT1, chloroplastic/amyloplastic/mitochondrial n=1 Tax=Auxenochlorella protothecoides TaxID=3075 RepID=A0A087SI27_AUXPR|nr:Adenine nucleotide transporter BT1, chloroplastic/amyloplastic/mitochondrial [Auxenochlorella protothecoides]KFM25381.1 Adenine nucleotide transporter BT1, chloroplastic/amyloplastic/mitochondrial [Auxenochlorella protothecoides]